jgi:integrase
VTIGKKPNGKPLRKHFYGHTGQEVDEKIKRFFGASQFAAVDESITLAEWADRWLEAYKSTGIKEITRHNTYVSIIENHIKPYFKDARLASIRPIDIKNFFNEKSAYSESILNKIKLNLNSIFEAAIDNDLIVKNPVKKITYSSEKESVEKRAYTKREVDDIIAFAKTHRLGAPVIVMLKTGLRRAELLALEWPDIDLKNKSLAVKGSVTESGGVIRIGPPKTKASMAPVVFDDELKGVFLSIPRTLKGDLVFPNAKGKPHSPSNWSCRNYKNFMAAYAAYCAGKELPPPRILTPHELRHTYGSLIYEATGDIYLTAKMLRNSVEVAEKTYVHERDETKRKALKKVSKLK